MIYSITRPLSPVSPGAAYYCGKKDGIAQFHVSSSRQSRKPKLYSSFNRAMNVARTLPVSKHGQRARVSRVRTINNVLAG